MLNPFSRNIPSHHLADCIICIMDKWYVD